MCVDVCWLIMPARARNRRSLQYNSLSGTIPASLGNLTNVFYLELNDNHIGGTLPGAIGELTGLVDLNLGGNALVGAVPSSVGNLVNLLNLNMAGNCLTLPWPPAAWAICVKLGTFCQSARGGSC